MTFVTVAVTFRPDIVRSALPPNMQPADDFSGGFSVVLAREGHFIAPFSAAYVWFDVQGRDGDTAPLRFLHRHFNSALPGSPLADPRAKPGLAVFSEGPDDVTASIGLPGRPALRLSIRPGQGVEALAGVDHYLMDGSPSQSASRIAVVPWAADWRDARPVSVELLSPDLAPLAPRRLLWSALGRKSAVTLGLSAALGNAATGSKGLSRMRLVG